MRHSAEVPYPIVSPDDKDWNGASVIQAWQFRKDTSQKQVYNQASMINVCTNNKTSCTASTTGGWRFARLMLLCWDQHFDLQLQCASAVCTSSRRSWMKSFEGSKSALCGIRVKFNQLAWHSVHECSVNTQALNRGVGSWYVCYKESRCLHNLVFWTSMSVCLGMWTVARQALVSRNGVWCHNDT